MKKALFIGMGLFLAGATGWAPLGSQNITVNPPARTTAEFVSNVSHDLDRQLERLYLRPNNFRGGFAQVRFTVSPDGHPQNVYLHRKSRDLVTDQAALKAVKRLVSLKSMPTSLGNDQPMQANILIAANDGQMKELRRLAARTETKRLARVAAGQEAPVLALTVAMMSAS